ncbi:transposable element Tcb1 transposase [Trichonephila clavipes]|nr:transposable element Tcb1 transposase [Trichonephila clavipes]
MPRGHRASFDQVSEFDRGRIVAYRDNGLSFREIGQRVGRNHTTTELLPWPACSPDLSPVENVWSMLAQRLARDTSTTATPGQLWQYVEPEWTAFPQGYIQNNFDSMPKRGLRL